MRRVALLIFGTLLCVSAPAKAELLVNMSKSQQRLSVTIDGTEAYRWPVSTGRRGCETPSGSFRATRLGRHWYSRRYELTPMPWVVFFHRGYAGHATMEAYNLGHAASHGCVRLRPDNAAVLYSLARKQGVGSTKVVVTNGPLPPVPGALPLAHEGAMERFAEASPEEADEYAAKAVIKAHDGDEAVERKPRTMRSGGVEPYRGLVGSDEAKIPRERQAWLRAIDRKYGFSR